MECLICIWWVRSTGDPRACDCLGSGEDLNSSPVGSDATSKQIRTELQDIQLGSENPPKPRLHACWKGGTDPSLNSY